MISVVLAVLGALGSPQGDVWAQLWTELDSLHDPQLAPAEAEALRVHLTEAARGLAGDVRAELLRAQLERLAGRDPSVVRRLLALEPDPFTPREHWYLADCLPSGPQRAQLALEALQSPTELERWQLFLAYNAGVDEARALRLDGAFSLQNALHERYRAEWSALDLFLTLKNLGRSAEADAVLAETIERETAAGRRPKVLWEHRGILALGFGDERLARDYLGRAMALGSDDAALLLARLDMVANSTLAARTGFRALILNTPPPDWAWRGWGTALLPSFHTAPATKTPPEERP
ncbi:MAG: hypothetical protein EXS08_05415 [Planctomycetes bacterium]|nr:hypothetical protein [Planctomycetota bacterium]